MLVVAATGVAADTEVGSGSGIPAGRGISGRCVRESRPTGSGVDGLVRTGSGGKAVSGLAKVYGGRPGSREQTDVSVSARGIVNRHKQRNRTITTAASYMTTTPVSHQKQR